MDADFWYRRWAKNEIAFHESEPNTLLVKYFNALSIEKSSRVFLPLCGKTTDIAWLLAKGYRVAGIDLSEIAIRQLFMDLGVEPRVSGTGKLKCYSIENVDIFVGDFFDLTSNILGPVDATYDRAALVALPEDMRSKYTEHLIEITNKAPQFLLCFEYDQRLMEGPPFSVGKKEVERHYEDHYELNLVASIDVPGGLKGKCVANENAWLLQN
ncbi:MAG: thiopurine S-methyltransferase [marine bacterium B5-7]|nr:MAG: thiopurine S-methyltransferase [marine bacterium B5-7]